MPATDFSISRFTRRCAVSGRAIKAGEAYYTAIRESDDDILRSDVAAEAWTGPPENTLAWWRGRLAPAGGPEAAPNDVLLKLLRDWADDSSRQPLRHLLALLLLRRKVLRVAQADSWLAQPGAQVSDAASAEKDLVRYNPADGGDPITVRAVVPPAEQIVELQQQLETLVYGDSRTQEAA